MSARCFLARFQPAALPAPSTEAVLALSTPAQALPIEPPPDDVGLLTWHNFQIVGDGETAMYDGSKVVVDAESAQDVIDDFNARGVDLPVDLDHAVLYNPSKGLPAPAVGWVVHNPHGTGLTYKPGAGIIASEVQWLPNGVRYVEEGAYRYHSPVLVVDPKTNRVKRLHSVALTNKPLTINASALRAASERLFGASEMPQDSSSSADGDRLDGDALLTKMGQVRGAMEAAGLTIPDDPNDMNGLFDALIEALKELRETKTEVASQRAMRWAATKKSTVPDRETVIAAADTEFRELAATPGKTPLCDRQAWIDQALRDNGLSVPAR